MGSSKWTDSLLMTVIRQPDMCFNAIWTTRSNTVRHKSAQSPSGQLWHVLSAKFLSVVEWENPFLQSLEQSGL